MLVLLVVDVQDIVVVSELLDKLHRGLGRSRGVDDIGGVRLIVVDICIDNIADIAVPACRLKRLVAILIILIIIDGIRGRGGFRPLRVQIDVLLLDGIGREVPLRAVCAGVGGVPAAEGVALPRGIVRLGELIAGLQILLRMIGIRFFVVVPVIRRRIRRRIPAVLLPDRIKRLGLGLAVASVKDDRAEIAGRIRQRCGVRILVPAEELIIRAFRLITAYGNLVSARIRQCNVAHDRRLRNADLLRARIAVICQREAVIARVLGIILARVRVIPLINEVDASLAIGDLDRADRDRGPFYPLVVEDVAVIQRDFIGIEPRLARRHVIQSVKPIPVEADAGLPELINLFADFDVRADTLFPCFRRQPAGLDHEELLCLMQVGQVEAIGEEAVLVAEIVEDTACAALVGVNDQRVRMRENRIVCDLEYRFLLADRDLVLVLADKIFHGGVCVAAFPREYGVMIDQIIRQRVRISIAVCVDLGVGSQRGIKRELRAGVLRVCNGEVLVLQTGVMENRARNRAVLQTVGIIALARQPVINDDLPRPGDQIDVIGIAGSSDPAVAAPFVSRIYRDA